MKKRNTSTFKKVLRTLGFVLVLVSALLIVTKIIASNSNLTMLEPLSELASKINDSLKFLNDYLTIIFSLGFLLIVFALRGTFGFIVMLIVAIALILYPGAELVHLFGVAGTSLSFMPEVLGDILASNKFISPIFLVLVAVFINLAMKNKKPKKFSLFWFGIATTILIVTVLLSVVNAEDFLDGMGLAFPITGYLFILSYLGLAVGSVFGVLGFSKD